MQADFLYRTSDAGPDVCDTGLVLSVFSDRPHVRATMIDDAMEVGFRLGPHGPVAELLGGAPRALGDVVIIDCPVADAATMAALVRLDARIAHCGAQLIISTNAQALDDVFACCDQSAPQILVDPSRGESVIALGRALATMPNMRLRDIAEEDRLALIRLTEQVGHIAEQLERLDIKGEAEGDGVFRFKSSRKDYHGQTSGNADDASEGLIRKSRPSLPDPRMVRAIIAQRQARASYFDGDLFADPAWDILLDLTAARAEHKRVSVTSLCIAAGVPPTTGLRWISQMVDSGILERMQDDTDRRRAFIVLSDNAADAMARYFAKVVADTSLPIL